MPRLIAVDLGAHQIKLSVFLASQGRPMEAEGHYVMRVPQDGSEAPSLGQRLAALDMLLEDHPELANGSGFVSACWPGEKATTHRLTLPFTDVSQVEKTLPFALEAEIPFDLDEMTLAPRIQVTDSGTDVRATLVRFEELSAFIEALASRGLNPRHVFVDGDVVGHLGSRERTSAILDVGHTHTTVSIARDRRVAYTRSVNVGGWTFARAIQGALQCEWSEALAYLQGRPLPTPASDDEPTEANERPAAATEDEVTDAGRLPDNARQALNGAIGLLLAEIRTTLIQAEDELGFDIEDVVLTGGGSRMSSLWDYLSQDLGMPVSRPVDEEGVPVPADQAVTYALAAQLAGITADEETDLRVGELVFRGGLDVSRAILVYGGAGLGFFVVAVFVMFVVQYQSLSSELSAVAEAVQAELVAIDPLLAEEELGAGAFAVSTMQAIMFDAEREAQLVGDSSGVPPTIDTVFNLSNAFPPHSQVVVDLDSVTISPAAIILKGETDDFGKVARIEDSLRRRPEFSTATKSNESKDSKGNVDFTISIDLGDKLDEGLDGEEI